MTGKELDKPVQRELSYLDERNRGWVAKHLVMAARYIDTEPELAFEHAEAASRRGGRVAMVREAVGLTAYAAGKFHDALRELRTYRRISGSDEHLALMADCERALGRVDKALETVESDEAKALTGAAGAEVAIVRAGILSDLGRHEEAVKALEIPGLNMNKAFSFSPRLFEAYAEALTAVGREDEAAKWTARIPVAEKALGIEEDEEEIIDLDLLLDDPEEDEDGDVLPSAADAVAGYRNESTSDGDDDTDESVDADEDRDTRRDLVDVEDGLNELSTGGEDEDGDLLPEGFEDPFSDDEEQDGRRDEAEEADDVLEDGDAVDEFEVQAGGFSTEDGSER